MMAKGEMDDFLKAYYRRLHINAMDYDVLARLVDNKKKGLLTREQEEWFDPAKGFLVADSNPQTNPYPKLGYRAKDLPKLNNTDELTKDELKKLYEAFAKAMAGMKTASALYEIKDEDAKNFVKRYVDDIKLFPTPKATAECENSITELINKLDATGKRPDEQETIKNIKQVILDETRKVDKDEKMFGQPEDLDKLLKKCADGKYNTDTSVQSKIQQVARTLDNYLNSWSYFDDTNTNTKQKNKAYLSSLSDDLSIIARQDAFSDIETTDTNLEKFRDIYGEELLNTLYHNKGIREKFREHDVKKITEKIDKAEGKINYQDPNSPNYVSPKTDDVLTPFQHIEKWATDTYNNSIRKYARLRGDPLLFSPFSKEICKAIDKEKVKPTDGVNGLIKKADDIKKRIPNKTVMEHFDWFLGTIGEINKNYPKAVDGAWQNADQMKCVITQIILKATGPNATDGDMEKAKTAMEIMTAMKYGMMTSKVMDAMKQTKFSIFSDGQLSWNKNEGIQFVTKAFDKSVKAAFLGIGYGVTIARNKIMMSGIKFKDKDNQSGPLAARMTEERRRLVAKQTADQHSVNDANAHSQTEINENQATLSDLDTNSGINNANIDQKRQDLEQRKQNLGNKKQELETKQATLNQYQQQHNEYEANKSVVDDYNQAIQSIPQLINEKTAKRNEIIALRQQILNPNTYIDPLTGMLMGKEEKKAHEQQLTENLRQLQAEYNDIDNRLTECQNKNTQQYYNTTVQPAANRMGALQNGENNYNNALNDYNTTQQQYDTMEADYNDLNSKVQQFTDATNKIQELNDTIEARNTAMQNWPSENRNKVKDLEDFWNFLQTGKTKTLRLNTERAQKKFDANKQIWLQNHISQHGLAA